MITVHKYALGEPCDITTLHCALHRVCHFAFVRDRFWLWAEVNTEGDGAASKYVIHPTGSEVRGRFVATCLSPGDLVWHLYDLTGLA